MSEATTDMSGANGSAAVNGSARAPKPTGAKRSAASAAAPERPTYGYTPEKEALIKRLHRIEGQVRGLEKMLAEDRYCIDIITQISAVTTALDAVAFKILDDHVNHCVTGALASGDEQVAAEKSRELLEAVHRFTRAR